MSMTQEQVDSIASAIRGQPFVSREQAVRVSHEILDVAAREIIYRGASLYIPSLGRSLGPHEIERCFSAIGALLDA